jgi:hypothetical protein
MSRRRGNGPWTVWSACEGREVTLSAQEIDRGPSEPDPAMLAELDELKADVCCVRCRGVRTLPWFPTCACVTSYSMDGVPWWPNAAARGRAA